VRTRSFIVSTFAPEEIAALPFMMADKFGGPNNGFQQAENDIHE